MKSRYVILLSALMLAAVTGWSQNEHATVNNPTAVESHQGHGDIVSKVDEQIRFFAAKLDLTESQQQSLKPIVERMDAATLLIDATPNLSGEERMARVRSLHMQAHQELRAFLNEDQKMRLDEFIQGAHSEVHGSTPAQEKPVNP